MVVSGHSAAVQQLVSTLLACAFHLLPMLLFAVLLLLTAATEGEQHAYTESIHLQDRMKQQQVGQLPAVRSCATACYSKS